MSATPGNPLVTVLIPAYNAANTIERALDSALMQDYEPMEVVVVNDASTDATADIVARYQGRNVRLLSLQENVGVCGAMNAGIASAAGEFIAFLDADDEWRAGKLSRQMAVMAGDPGVVFVTSDGDYLGADGVVRTTVYSNAPPAQGTEAWKTLLAYCFVAKPCVLARREAIVRCGGFDADLRLAEDQDMWIRLAQYGAIACLPDSLVKIHLTPGSLTHSNLKAAAQYLLPMINRHLDAIGPRLSPSERRAILALRWHEVGRSLYEAGFWIEGAPYLLRAMLRGFRPLFTLRLLAMASPPVRGLKRLLR